MRLSYRKKNADLDEEFTPPPTTRGQAYVPGDYVIERRERLGRYQVAWEDVTARLQPLKRKTKMCKSSYIRSINKMNYSEEKKTRERLQKYGEKPFKLSEKLQVVFPCSSCKKYKPRHQYADVSAASTTNYCSICQQKILGEISLTFERAREADHAVPDNFNVPGFANHFNLFRQANHRVPKKTSKCPFKAPTPQGCWPPSHCQRHSYGVPNSQADESHSFGTRKHQEQR